MKPVLIRDKDEIERYFRRDTFLHLYEIGDLDDPYWEGTNWYALKDGDEIRALALFYTGIALPVLLALTSERVDSLRELLAAIAHELPGRFYAHMTSGVEEVFGDRHDLEPHGTHLKMALNRPELLDQVDTSDAVRLSLSDLDEMISLYDASYPGHWFEEKMLTGGQYYGLRRDGKLVSIAGVHVFSKRYRVAALGNITTLPTMRGQGLARVTTAALCRSLLVEADQIGLNVKDDNLGAIACYERLGFERCGIYGEYMVEVKGA